MDVRDLNGCTCNWSQYIFFLLTHIHMYPWCTNMANVTWYKGTTLHNRILLLSDQMVDKGNSYWTCFLSSCPFKSVNHFLHMLNRITATLQKWAFISGSRHHWKDQSSSQCRISPLLSSNNTEALHLKTWRLLKYATFSLYRRPCVCIILWVQTHWSGHC